MQKQQSAKITLFAWWQWWRMMHIRETNQDEMSGPLGRWWRVAYSVLTFYILELFPQRPIFGQAEELVRNSSICTFNALTFDQSAEEAWPDQLTCNDKDNDKDKDKTI